MLYDFTRYGLLAFVVLLAVTPYAALQFKNKSPAAALMFALILVWMFGPNLAEFDLPLLPGYDKTQWAAIGAFIGLCIFASRRLQAAKPGRGVDLFIILLCLGDLASFLTNQDPLMRGPTYQTGLTINDAVYYIEQDLVSRGLPLLLGRACFQNRKDALTGLRLFTIFGLVYTPLILWEIRMSPQLHRQIYGYGMNYGFAQSMRDGGFRPEVFLQHGLILGMFVMTVTFTAIALYRVGQKRLVNMPTGMVALGLVALSVLVKAKGAMVFTFVGGLALFRLPAKTQLWIACVLALIVPAYTYLHVSEQFPADELMEQLEPFGADRLQSMQFRLDNELSLVQRAKDRLLFGWGGYERERIFDEEGHNLSTQDGAWIIVLGLRGVVGFIAFFGALIYPLIYAALKVRKLKDERDRRLLACFAMVTAMLTLNMLPNMAIENLPFMMAGGTMGLASGLLAEQSRRRKQQLRARRQAAQAPAAPPEGDGRAPTPPPQPGRPGREQGDEPEPSVIISIPTRIR